MLVRLGKRRNHAASSRAKKRTCKIGLSQITAENGGIVKKIGGEMRREITLGTMTGMIFRTNLVLRPDMHRWRF
jgi:hypothetical protein